MRSKKIYSVGEAATICSVSVKTLHYYEQYGILSPAIKKENGYRYYDVDQLLQVHLIKRLKEMNFSLDEIKRVLDNNTTGFLEECVKEKLEKIEEEIEYLQTQALGTKIFLERLHFGNSILSAEPLGILSDAIADIPTLERIPAKHVISSRRIIKGYRNEDINIERWGELIELAKKERASTFGPITVVYHCGPLEQFYATECDYEVYMECTSTSNSSCFRDMEATQAVTALHVGPYAGLQTPYIKIMRWIVENGYEIAGSFRDEFIVSPIDTRNENEYLTKIIVPVTKRNTPV